MSQAVRAFLAIRVPDDLVEEATRVQDTIREQTPEGGVRWVDSLNFHLTVRFFGNLGPDEVACAKALVQARSFGPVEVGLGELSAFPSVARPQVLWLGLESEDEFLESLVESLERSLRDAGFGPADKPWKSHLTLGRVARGNRLSPQWNRSVSYSRRSFRLDTLALMRSDLLPEGAHYTALATSPARAG